MDVCFIADIDEDKNENVDQYIYIYIYVDVGVLVHGVADGHKEAPMRWTCEGRCECIDTDVLHSHIQLHLQAHLTTILCLHLQRH